MKIETKRLFLYPIDNDAMELLIRNERDEEMKKAYCEMLQGCLEHPQNRIWYAVWLMELKDSGAIVGDFCFKGLNEDGMVEIGYGLRDGCCGNGYMTEALDTIANRVLNLEYISRIEAETEPSNIASQKVLRSCGFTPTGTIGEEGPRFVKFKA